MLHNGPGKKKGGTAEEGGTGAPRAYIGISEDGEENITQQCYKWMPFAKDRLSFLSGRHALPCPDKSSDLPNWDSVILISVFTPCP